MAVQFMEYDKELGAFRFRGNTDDWIVLPAINAPLHIVLENGNGGFDFSNDDLATVQTGNPVGAPISLGDNGILGGDNTSFSGPWLYAHPTCPTAIKRTGNGTFSLLVNAPTHEYEQFQRKVVEA